MKLLLATNNAKKAAELRELVSHLGLSLVTPADCGGLPEVVEDQPTFAGNAEKKARSAALATGLWALADDSGLEVDHLNGAPGVRSARYAGEACDDAANNAKLLGALEGVPEGDRGAGFRCHLALARPDGTIAAGFDGRTRGRILEQAQGAGGFGYDPLFLFTEPGFPATGKAFAELESEEKSAVSHRGRALRALVDQLDEILAREDVATDTPS